MYKKYTQKNQRKQINAIKAKGVIFEVTIYNMGLDSVWTEQRKIGLERLSRR